MTFDINVKCQVLTPSLRIAHIDTERTWRGGEQQMVSLMKGLQSRGHTNLAVVKRGSALAQKLWGDGRSLFPIRTAGEWDLWAARVVNRRLRTDEIDIVHAHTGHGVALAALATLGTSIPFVVTRRVDFHLNGNPFTQWKYARARRVVAISDGVKTILRGDGVPESKITVVKSGIDFSRYDGLRPASAEEMGVPRDALIVGQVAAFADHKDQPTFLRAMAALRKKFPQLRAVLVGEGSLRTNLEALAGSLGIADIVCFLGFKEDALRYLKAFHVFCLSSKEEGLGTSLLDAMALGVPVVATAAGGIPELVDNGETGYLAAVQDPNDLARALEEAIRAGEKNRVICENAYRKAKEFDISRTVSRMEEVYRSVLAPAGAYPQ